MLWLIFYLALFIINFTLLRWIFKHLMLRRSLRLLPSPNSTPIMGFNKEIIKRPEEERFQWFNKFCYQFESGIVLMWFGAEPLLIIRKPQHIEVILSDKRNMNKGDGYKSVKPWLGETGLILSSGPIWQTHRRMLTPAFHFISHENYIIKGNKNFKILNNLLEEHVENDPRAPIDILKMITMFMFDIIAETGLGVRVDSQRQSKNLYIDGVDRFKELRSQRFLRPWLNWDSIFSMSALGRETRRVLKTLNDFTSGAIEQRIAERRNTIHTREANKENSNKFNKNKRYLDGLLDLYDQKNGSMSMEEVKDEVKTFLFASYDTTSATIAYTLFALGNIPEVQSRVQEELNEVFETPDEDITMQHLTKLKYLDRVIKEAQRVYTIVPQISRKLDNSVKLDNYVIPRGTNVLIHIYQLHNDPEVWKDPEIFNPDRFLPENSAGRHAYAFVPFSAGPRNCLGQKIALLQVKLLLANILRKWRVSSVLKPHEIRFKSRMILKPIDGKVEIYLSPIRD